MYLVCFFLVNRLVVGGVLVGPIFLARKSLASRLAIG